MSGEALRVGVCGVGTVGLATIEILRQQSDLISARAGRAVKFVTWVRAETTQTMTMAMHALAAT